MMNTTQSSVVAPSNYKSYSASKLISKILAYVFLVILSVIWLYTILWLII